MIVRNTTDCIEICYERNSLGFQIEDIDEKHKTCIIHDTFLMARSVDLSDEISLFYSKESRTDFKTLYW